MIDRVDEALEKDTGDLAQRLQQLVDAARYVSLVRRSHSGSKALYEQTALLLIHSGKLPDSFH